MPTRVCFFLLFACHNDNYQSALQRRRADIERARTDPEYAERDRTAHVNSQHQCESRARTACATAGLTSAPGDIARCNQVRAECAGLPPPRTTRTNCQPGRNGSFNCVTVED